MEFRTTYYVAADSYHFKYLTRLVYNFKTQRWQVKMSKNCLTTSREEADRIAATRDKTHVVIFEEYVG